MANYGIAVGAVRMIRVKNRNNVRLKKHNNSRTFNFKIAFLFAKIRLVEVNSFSGVCCHKRERYFYCFFKHIDCGVRSINFFATFSN